MNANFATTLLDAPDIAPKAEVTPPPQACSLSALVRQGSADPGELLRHRFLCRGGGLLLCGPTGIGKSSLSLQCAMLWALGRPAFGIEPARPLRSLLIQAENDSGDLAEMRDGVIRGLGLTAEEAEAACDSITVCREDARVGLGFFFEVVRPLLAEHKPDLLWIDPVLAYLGGEANAQRDVGAFLRNGLNPLLHEYNCGGVVIHHTNKPATGREKGTWQAGDFAYLGAGSAEWANWARAVLALRSIGSRDVFELQAGKRGGRLGWREADGQTKAFARHLAHATEPGGICWREVAAPEEPVKPGRPKQFDADEVLSLLPPEGLSATDWQQAALKECGMKESTFHRNRKALAKAGRVLKSQVSGRWQPVGTA